MPSRVLDMDPGSIIIATIGAVAGAASAIIAWSARADSLDAADRAKKAEAAALRAWEQSANALKEANDLSVAQYADRLARERKIRRVEVAEHFRRWYTEEAIRVVMGEAKSAQEQSEKRDLLIRLTATGEPGASALATEVIRALSRAKKGELKTGLEAAAEITDLTSSWINDPETFVSSREASITMESLTAELQKAVSSIEADMAGREGASAIEE